MKFHKKHAKYGDIYNDAKFLRNLVKRRGRVETEQILNNNRMMAESEREFNYWLYMIRLFQYLYTSNVWYPNKLICWQDFVIHFRRYHT